ncbi:hypothetical protein MLD38_039735 [Melastoma candidum]|uniref:Uncharacterized protein n=1 Tax=Melastoma candidum TaxID=119954 RepID=A0ACB9L459_9MYRT|nr:hypothetical protein MLD38_039735 [Melastoma candidum]
MELFVVQKTCITLVVNPPSFALNDAPTICQHFPFGDHHLVSSWRGSIFILWRREEVSIHFFEELIATASVLVMDNPRNIFSDV